MTPWSNRFDYDYNKPSYGRGPAPWQSEAPRARHVGGRMTQPQEAGRQLNFGGQWPGDPEFQTPRIDSTMNTVRQFAGNYLGTKLALGNIGKDIHVMEEDVHALRYPPIATPPKKEQLALPPGSRAMPPPEPPRALGPGPTPIPQGPVPSGDRPKYGLYGDVDAGDARLAGHTTGQYSLRGGKPFLDTAPGRRTTGGNDRRLKGLIQRQLDDRM